jgi:hypothetical protein
MMPMGLVNDSSENVFPKMYHGFQAIICPASCNISLSDNPDRQIIFVGIERLASLHGLQIKHLIRSWITDS